MRYFIRFLYMYKSVRHKHLTQLLKTFRFWIWIRRDIRNKKILPAINEKGSPQRHVRVTLIQGVADSVCHWYRTCLLNFFLDTHASWLQRVANSAHRWNGELLTLRFLIRGVVDSAYRWWKKDAVSDLGQIQRTFLGFSTTLRRQTRENINQGCILRSQRVY